MQLREATESPETMVTDCDIAVIVMDFQKNLTLHLTGVSQEYTKGNCDSTIFVFTIVSVIMR